MQVKKSPRANLESKKSIFLQIGLVLVLAVVLIAFEWTFTEIQVSTFIDDGDEFIEEDIIPITRTLETPPPPPPPKPRPADIIIMVDNVVELDDQIDFFSSEQNDDDLIAYIGDFTSYNEEDRENITFEVVEQMPKFPGGDSALLRYLAENVRYPSRAQQNGLYGRVYVKFVINQFGEVCEVEIARGVHPSLDGEAIRVVENMPNWEPGRQRGVPVRVKYTVPINFVLK